MTPKKKTNEDPSCEYMGVNVWRCDGGEFKIGKNSFPTKEAAQAGANAARDRSGSYGIDYIGTVQK